MHTLFRLAALAAAALALLGATLPATAAPAQPAAKASPAKKKTFIHPELRKAQAHAAQLRAQAKAERKRLGAQVGPEDVTPPVLTAFSVDGKVNLRRRGEQVVAHWTLSDDLSGGYYVYAVLTGPSGQTTAISKSIGYTDTAWSDHAVFSLDWTAEPGNWAVDYAWAYDLRGNWAEFDAAALAALGNTVVKVANRTYDVLPPAVSSGEILTPTVTLSKNPPGMPYTFGDDFKMRVTAADTAGGAVVSGVNYVYAYFCRWEADNCTYALGMSSSDAVWGDPHSVLTLGARLTPGYSIGTYTLYHLQVQDNAGNWVQYLDVNHGGETDFSTMFPGGASFEVLP